MLRLTWKVLRKSRSRDRGAALITVLLFVVLMFILITAMLTVTGNEIVIAGLQKDGMRATDLAQAGIQEAIARVASGRPYTAVGGWTSSIDPRVTVTVTRVFPGANSAYLQIDSVASNIGKATRRLTALVLQQVIAFPPNVTFAYSVTEQGSADISCGDAYSQTFLRFKNYPSNSCGGPRSLTYTGWRVSKTTPGSINPCLTHADCVAQNPGNPDVANWYPGTRRTTPQGGADGADILGFEADADSTPCNAAGPTYNQVLPSGSLFVNGSPGSGVKQYGFDLDTPAGKPSQLDPDTFPCGLPFKYISEVVYDENGAPLVDGTCASPPGGVGCRWFKTVVFEEWYQNYWVFDVNQMTAVKRGGGPCVDGYCVKANVGDPSPTVQPNLLAYPEFGAVPPFPDMTSITNNYDCKYYSATGASFNSLPLSCTRPDGSTTTSDLGTAGNTKIWVMTCDAGGQYHINGNISGYGTLVINCDLVVNGTFTYYGTIIVNGTLQAGTGNVTVNGGLVAQDTLRLIGNITVVGGGTIADVPTGNSLVIGRAWWEH